MSGKHRSAPAQSDSDLTAPGAVQAGVSATPPGWGRQRPRVGLWHGCRARRGPAGIVGLGKDLMRRERKGIFFFFKGIRENTTFELKVSNKMF